MAIRETLCPVCFRRFALAAVHFRCRNPRCPAERDPIHDKAHRAGALMRHAFEPPRTVLSGLFGIEKAVCDQCNEETTKRLCPHCHFELLYDIGKVEDHPIAIIGARGSGKGHYIVTLVRQLENEIGDRLGFSIKTVGDESRKRFEEEYRTPLLRDGRVLAATQSALSDTAVKAPIVFRLSFGRAGHAFNLSFFDTAGEDLQSLDTMSSEARYITSAHGIVFLLDPLQIPAVRQRLSGTRLPAKDDQADPVYIVERLYEVFERAAGLKQGQKVRIPVAFALSKVDALFPIIDPGSTLRTYSNHSARFNDVESQSVDTEIRSYLETWDGVRLTRRVEGGFANHRYFGISALGQPPSPEGTVESVDSLRVEDPFLWILFSLGLIKGNR